MIWTGTVAGTRSSRPTFRPGTKSTDPKVYAHRWIYEQMVGPIPEGYEVDHLCNRGLCVRISHLEAVTPKQNTERNRLHLCTEGLHDLDDPENCTWDAKGRRRGCKLCKRTKALAAYYRNKGGQ